MPESTTDALVMRRSEPRKRVTKQEIKSIVDKFADIVRVLVDADPTTKPKSGVSLDPS